jgi:hypothetical protein
VTCKSQLVNYRISQLEIQKRIKNLNPQSIKIDRIKKRPESLDYAKTLMKPKVEKQKR